MQPCSTDTALLQAVLPVLAESLYNNIFSDIGIHFCDPSHKLSGRVILTLQTLGRLCTEYIFQIFTLSRLPADSIL